MLIADCFCAGDYTPGSASGAGVNQLIHGGPTPVSVNSLSKTGDIHISQSEFIGNLTASVTTAGAGVASSDFSLESYEINPGLSKLFPFLAQIAQNYDMYELIGLVVTYRPNSGETSVSSNQLGKVMIATNYDPDCDDFINSIEMQNYDYANAGKPSQMLVHGVETHPAQRASKMLYVRDSLSTKDRVLTDIGKLYVATEGVPIEATAAGITRVVLGELHVAYKVRLSRAKLYTSLLGYGISTDRFKYETSAGVAAPWFPATGSSDIVKWAHNAGTWDFGHNGTGAEYDCVATEHLVAGTYKWVFYMGGHSSAGQSLVINSIATHNSSLSIVKQHTHPGTIGNFVQGSKTTGSDTSYAASGYVTVNNTSDHIPGFTITLSANQVVLDGACMAKFSITQISSRLEDSEW